MKVIRRALLLTGIVMLWAQMAFPAPNLVPPFVEDGLGGFLGWDNDYMNMFSPVTVEKVAGKGPDGRDMLHFSGEARSMRYEAKNIKLVKDARYRLSAKVRTHAMVEDKLTSLILRADPWSDHVLLPFPVETAGKWRDIVWEGVAPKSRKGNYAVSIHGTACFKKDGYLDIADIRLEPLSAEGAEHVAPVASVSPYVSRIVPIDPILSEMNAKKAEMLFVFQGPVGEAAESYVLKASFGGKTVSAPLGTDHRAKVSFGAVKPGKGLLTVAVVGAKSGKIVATNDYLAATLPEVASPTPVRRLNNFVAELYTKPLKNGSYEFTLAKPGWVYISLDRPYETVTVDIDNKIFKALRYRAHEASATQRYLEPGKHTLKVHGVWGEAQKGLISVRLVKTILGSFERAVHRPSDYAQFGLWNDFYWKFGMFSVVNTADFAAWMYPGRNQRRIDVEFNERGQDVCYSKGPGGHHPDRDSIPALIKNITGEYPAIFKDRSHLTIDENAIGVETLKKYNAAEALWRIGRDSGPVNVWFEDGFHAIFTRPLLDASELSSIINAGGGRTSCLIPEAYYYSVPDEKGYAKAVDFVRRQWRSVRAVCPAACSRFVFGFNGWMYPGVWTTWNHPQMDANAFYVSLLHLMATDPEFADIGGAGMATPACDEDVFRFFFAAFRHYCLEGRTDDFCAQNGMRLFPGHIVNNDFDEGLAGWKVEGSVSAGEVKGFGMKRYRQKPPSPKPIGDRFACFTTRADGTNRLSQTVKGLTPGRLYQFEFVSADYADVVKTGNAKYLDTPICFTIRGAQRIAELDHVVRKAGKKGSPSQTAIYVHRYVFRATDVTAEVVISDCAEGSLVKVEPGARFCVNYVICRPYYVRDDEELERLKEHNVLNNYLMARENGRGWDRYVIVPKEKLSPSEKCVLDDMRALLKRALGTEIPVSSLKDAPHGRCIFFGIAPAGETMANFAPDEHAVTVNAGDVYLYGKGPNGTRYATYDFLQDDLGFRFFDVRDGVKIPDLRKVSLKPGTRRIVYSFGERVMSYWHVRKASAGKFYVRNGQNRDIGMRDASGKMIGFPAGFRQPFPGCHGLVVYLPRNGKAASIPIARKICGENLEKEHPEYFTMDSTGKRVFDSQRCFSNPGMRALLKKVLLAHMATLKQPSYVDLSAGDTGGHFCYCPACKALEQKYASPGGPLFDFVLEFCPEMAQKFPQHRLMSLVYRKAQTQHPPKGIAKMPDNFTPYFAPIDDDFSKDWTSPANAETLADLRTWGRLCKNVFMWYYPNPYRGAAYSPLGNMERLVTDLRFAYQAGSRSAYCEHDVGVKPLIGFTELQAYVIQRLFRDITLDENALVAEFCDFEYGAASQGVQAYLHELEALRKTMKLDFPWDPTEMKFVYMTPERMKKWNASFDLMEKALANDRTRLRNLRRVRFPLDVTIARVDAKCVPEAIARAKAVTREIAEDAFDDYAKAERESFVKSLDNKLLLAEITNGKIAKPLPGETFGAYAPAQIFTTLPLAHARKMVDDPDAAFGKAGVFDGTGIPQMLKLPFACDVERPDAPSLYGVGCVKAADLPKDGGYKIYDMGKGTLTPQSSIRLPQTWWGLKADIGQAYVAGTFNRARFFASLKFEGPVFYPVQTNKANRVLCDRIIVVHEE